MPFTLTMPKLSPTMEEGTIVKWHKKEGEFVSSGDLLIDVATDKANVEYQALDEGWLRQILVQEGKSAKVNEAIAVLSEEANENVANYKPAKIAEVSSIEKTVEKISEAKLTEPSSRDLQPKASESFFQAPQFLPENPLEEYVFDSPIERIEKRILASPLAKKIAKEKGLDLSTVKGSGPNHRIMSRDLSKAQLSSIAPFYRREAPTKLPGTYEEEPLSPMRKAISQRLQSSKSFIPHFYVSMNIDAEPLTTLRNQLISYGIKPSINDFIVKACAYALREHPVINSGFNSANQSIIHFKTIDIAVAVSLDDGLITPIIRHADYKNLGEISLEIRSLIQRAKVGKLLPQEYKGGSFTVSNLGMYGISEFQAILNPPQAAILAVGGIRDVPVVRNATVVPGKELKLTLSADHRAIDGAMGALFLQTLKKLLENPSILIFT